MYSELVFGVFCTREEEGKEREVREDGEFQFHSFIA
jgi:hypothetical protein